MQEYDQLYGAPFVKILYLADLAQKLLYLRIFSYLCTHLAISAYIYLNLHAYVALKGVGGKHGILSEEKLGVLFQ